MFNWVFILHFYQPPTQSLGLTDWVLHTCYLPLLDRLLENPAAQMSLNITGSLLVQIKSLPNHDFFGKLKTLLDHDQVELLTCPAYHPILPLTQKNVALEQIEQGEKIVADLTGSKSVAGLFPPELALDNASLMLLKDRFNFVLADSSCGIDRPLAEIDGLKVLLNNREICEIIRSYPTELFANKLIDFVATSNSITNDSLLVTVSDAEIFGHHYSERINFFSDLLKSKEIKFLKASQAVGGYEVQPTSVEKFQPSSWQEGVFDLWTKNDLQKEYLRLAHNVYVLIKDLKNPVSLEHFDQGISSCHLYWLSHHPWWHPDLVEAGTTHLIKAVRSETKLSLKDKSKMENEYRQFVTSVWQYHWSGEVEKNYQKFEQEREEFLKTLPVL